MQIGVMVEGQDGLGWDLWRRLYQAVEDFGFESLWRSDHFFAFSGNRTKDSLEPFVSMAVLAVETKRIRFGPLVTSVTFRHPAVVARMAAQIDQLSGGRLTFGMGAGWNIDEHSAFGIPFPPTGERLDRLEEAIQVVQALWADGPANFEGRFYPLNGAECYPKPTQQPLPILVGGNGERRTLRLVAQYANQWNGIYLDVNAYRAKCEILERHCHDVGRDPTAIEHSLMLGIVIGRDEQEIARRLDRLSDSPIVTDAQGSDGLAATLLRLQRKGWLIGSPTQIVETLGHLSDAGVSRVMLHHLDKNDFDALELIAAEVLPQAQT